MALKRGHFFDEPTSVAVPPPSGAVGPTPGPPQALDMNQADWRAAEQRRAGAAPDAATTGFTTRPLDLSAASGTTAPEASETAPAIPAWGRPAWEKRQRLVKFTRAWAVVKMAISAVSTWLSMSSLHAKLGETVCGYGVVCFWWAIGPHWRKRCFGPGQKLEPDLYEGIASWCWRIGTVLVLVGGGIYLLQLR